MKDLKIFICAHNRINNELPDSDDSYIIAAQNENVNNTEFPVILMNDEFTKNHKIGYGECCQIHYVWQHPELIDQYVGFCHYRRFFEQFMHSTDDAIPLVEKYGAIVAKSWTCGLPNKIAMRVQHFQEYTRALEICVKETHPEYTKELNEFLEDKNCCYCNMFIMKKEDFLEGAEFVFDVLEKLDEYFNVHNDNEVREYITNLQRKFHWRESVIKWQVRMEGFFAEYLWDIFRRKKFKNSYQAKLKVIGDRDISYQS